MLAMFDSIDDAAARLAQQCYFVDRDVATTVFLGARLRKPILIEGERGSGKSDLARAIAKALDTKLIRLQCYEGIDEEHAVYGWDQPRQLLRMQLAAAAGEPIERAEREVFTEEYLLKRPILEALTLEGPAVPVLLIDEMDRADERFETSFLDILTGLEVTIPGLGALEATRPPLIVLTSNGARALSGALKARCLYLWLSHPTFDREYEVLTTKVPGISHSLAGEICNFMQRIRAEDFRHCPGIAETIAWGTALAALHRTSLDPEIVDQTIGCVFNNPSDIDRFRSHDTTTLMRPSVDRAG